MKAIIGVFGATGLAGGGALADAREIGAILARRDAIALTGANGVSDRGVKGAAVLGARDAGGAWIGVDPAGDGQPHASQGGIVLSTSLGHKRNYVEAALCHGAICLAGGDGTLSEAVFTLSLGKPVAFRGEGWTKQLRLPEQSDVLAETACEKVWTEGSMDFQAALDPKKISASLRATTRYRIFKDSDSLKIIVEWILSEVIVPKNAFKPADFPEFEGSSLLADAYCEWLSGVSIERAIRDTATPVKP